MGKKDTRVAEITLPAPWRRGSKIEIGDELILLADNILVILPPGISEEEEKRVREFVGGKGK